MITIPPVSLSHLADLYLLASTPGFLSRKYRASGMLEPVVANCTVMDLLATIDEIAAKPDRSPSDLALGYACLVALTMKPLLETAEKVHAWGFGRLEWDEYIWTAHESQAVATTEATTFPGQLVVPQARSTSTTQLITLP